MSLLLITKHNQKIFKNICVNYTKYCMTRENKRSTKKAYHRHMHEDHNVTFHGLHNWHNHVFEHYGWILLAKRYGYMDKVHSYKSSLYRLKEALEKRMKTLHEKDRKDDLKILHQDVEHLIAECEM